MSGILGEPTFAIARWGNQMDAKRWNEGVRLVSTFLNASSIGAFGLSVLAPMKDANRFSPVGDAVIPSKLGMDEPFSITDGVVWPLLALALIMHFFAHIVVAFMEEED
jgi:hypothetical protein